MICMKQPAKKNRMSEMCLRCRLAPWWTSPVTNWFVDQFSVNQQKASIHSTDWEPSGTIFVFRCLDPRMQRQWQASGCGWGGMSGNGGFWLGDKLRRVQWRPTAETEAQEPAAGSMRRRAGLEQWTMWSWSGVQCGLIGRADWEMSHRCVWLSGSPDTPTIQNEQRGRGEDPNT